MARTWRSSTGRASTPDSSSSEAEHDIPVAAASPGLLDALRGRVVTGRVFDSGHDRRADPIALLEAGATERLDINRIDNQPTVFVGDRPSP